MTRAAIFTRRWVAGDVLVLAILASVSARTHASANETTRLKSSKCFSFLSFFLSFFPFFFLSFFLGTKIQFDKIGDR